MAVTSTSLLQSLGASSIDTKELVTNLTNAIKEPRQKLIDAEKQKTTLAISNTALLKSALATLEAAASEVGSASNLSQMTINSGDSSVVTATKTSGAVAEVGSYAISVSQLAKPQRTTIELPRAFALNTSYGITLSRTTSDAPPVTTNVSVALQAGASPAEIVTAINSSTISFGVRATLVDTKTGTNPLKIVLESNSGTDSAFSYAATATSGSSVEMQPASTTAAQNALFEVNGIALQRQSNTVTDAITGLTLQLNSAVAGKEVRLSATADTSGLIDKVKNLVESYNMIREFLVKATGEKVSGDDVAGSLQNNTTAKGILVKLRTAVLAKFTAKPTAVAHWNALGVAFDRSGVLQFDQSKFLATFDKNRAATITALTNDAPAPYVYAGLPSGLAGDIAVLAHNLTKNSGTVATMTAGLEQTLKRVDKKQIDLDAQIQRITAQYEKQFTAMETILSSFKNTQAQLTQTFSNKSDN